MSAPASTEPRHRPDPARVRRMFADVAPRYDFMNRTLSAGTDRRWRRRTVARALAGSKDAQALRLLDLCTGTGDLALAFAKKGLSVVGLDFCPEMLGLARAKRERARATELAFCAGDALHLPFEAESFDLATVAFGIRNVADVGAFLAEVRRVLRPSGRLLVLEFARPRAPILGPLYLWYFRRVLPLLGRALAPRSRKSEAYTYLPESVLVFPEREDFCALLVDAGFDSVGFELLSLGIAALYEGRRPDA